MPDATQTLDVAAPRAKATKGLFFALVGTITLSCNYSSAKLALIDPNKHAILPEGFNPETFTFLWMTAATIYSLLLVGARGGIKTLAVRGRPLYWMLALGLANTLAQLFMWQGLARLDPSFASLLGRFTPMMVILMGVFLFRERIRGLEWLAIAIMIGGGCISSLANDRRMEVLGIVLTLASNFFTAVQWIFGKYGSKGLSSMVMNFYRVFVAAVLGFIWAVITHRLDFSTAHLSHWLAVIIGAFLGPFLSYVLIFRSYKYWNLSSSAIVLTLQPIFVIPTDYFIFGALLTGKKLLGDLTILAGAVWLAVVHRSAEEDLPPEDVPTPVDEDELKAKSSV